MGDEMKKFFSIICFSFLCFGCQAPQESFPQDVEVVSQSSSWHVDDMNDYAQSYLLHIDPKVYEIVARRTTNKLLTYTAPIAEKAQRPTIFVAKPQILDPDLPDNFAYAHKITRDLLDNAQAFMVVNQPDVADYFLDIEVDTVQFKNSPTPVIIYTLILSDYNDNVLQEWSETIRQVKNDDQSWW